MLSAYVHIQTPMMPITSSNRIIGANHEQTTSMELASVNGGISGLAFHYHSTSCGRICEPRLERCGKPSRTRTNAGAYCPVSR